MSFDHLAQGRWQTENTNVYVRTRPFIVFLSRLINIKNAITVLTDFTTYMICVLFVFAK
jgi:hypothetical protein